MQELLPLTFFTTVGQHSSNDISLGFYWFFYHSVDFPGSLFDLNCDLISLEPHRQHQY